MKYTTLALSTFLAGCGASIPSTPVASEPLPCASERTLQDEVNGIFVTLSTKNVSGQISYGDFSHFFEVIADANAGENFCADDDSCGFRFDLYHGNSFLGEPVDTSLRFKDGAPFTSLDSVTICRYDGRVQGEVCEPLSNTKNMDFLHETYETLIKITINHFNNQKDLVLEKKLMDAYDAMRLIEGY